MEIMDHSNARWDEFIDRLEGPAGCDFKEKEPGNVNSVTWKCAGGHDKSIAIKILEDMGDIDIPESLRFFDKNGGHCDCEILFNVA